MKGSWQVERIICSLLLVGQTKYEQAFNASFSFFTRTKIFMFHNNSRMSAETTSGFNHYDVHELGLQKSFPYHQSHINKSDSTSSVLQILFCAIVFESFFVFLSGHLILSISSLKINN